MKKLYIEFFLSLIQTQAFMKHISFDYQNLEIQAAHTTYF